MLSDLFNDPNNENWSTSNSSSSKYNADRPPSKRKEINFCGIINQGATCYLNTLIQTLFLTREFRDNLFSLSEEEIGLIPSTDEKQSKVRVILIELQRLFAQLLMLDQDSCSTNRLTESFGWTNNEELQQHDVQELNRILFHAIEKNLNNTKQSKLIQELYRGTCVNKIKCLTCLNVFQREEEFLDLPITVQGSPGLEFSLLNSFVLRENLNGSNQYRCEKCNNEYRDAEKYCQLKTLPPILTFSLLRFTYDLKTYQRIKETSKFDFPIDLDLIKYMEDSLISSIDPEYTKYELFSVIIHSGSAYGGHYHTLIKDFDELGNWVLMKKDNNKKVTVNKPTTESQVIKKEDSTGIAKEICLICCDDEQFNEKDKKDQELVNLDYLKYEHPLELLKAFIYNRYKYEKIKIDQVCVELTKQSGMSWNKNFKPKFGTIEKFLKKHDDTFDVDLTKKIVNLKQHEHINLISSQQYSSKNELIESCLKEVEEDLTNNKPQNTETIEIKEEINEINEVDDVQEEIKSNWYDFDDSKVIPVLPSSISKQFEGKESAYMLFYRRKTNESSSSKYSSHDKVPVWLRLEMENENAILNNKRIQYENRENQHKIECFLCSDFYCEQSVLNLKQEFEDKSFIIDFDKRSTKIADLKQLLVSFCTSTGANALQKRNEACLNVLFDDSTPFYWLLAKRIDTSSSSSTGRYSYYIKSVLNDDELLFSLTSADNIKNGKPMAKSFLILSKNVDKWPIGDQFEPVRIIIKFYDPTYQIKETSYTFTKNTSIQQVKEEICAFYLCEHSSLTSDLLVYTLVPNKTTRSSLKDSNEKILLDESQNSKTLEQLNIKNGDVITIETVGDNEQFFENNLKKLQFNENIMQSDLMGMRKIHVINAILGEQKSNDSQMNNSDFEFDLAETINSIRIIAMSSFDLNSEQNGTIHFSHLRYISEENLNKNELLANYFSTFSSNPVEINKALFTFPGVCLSDDMLLKDVISSNKILDDKIIFLLCPGRAPVKSNNEIMIRSLIDKKLLNEEDKAFISDEPSVEVIVNVNQNTISDLTLKIVEKAGLTCVEAGDDEVYYLITLDWLGDPNMVLNNLDILCKDAKLESNQNLLLTKGKLVPPDHYKIKTYISTDHSINNLTKKMENVSITEESEPDEVILNNLIENKYKQFKYLDELIVENSIKLEDLVILIQSLLIDRTDISECEHLRLRLLKNLNRSDEYSKLGKQQMKFQMKKSLFEMHKQLKHLNFTQETDLCIQILDKEDEHLNQGIILIDCIQLNLSNRLCKRSSFRQIFWNVNNGATLNSLKESILKTYSDLLEPSDIYRMQIAKRQIDKLQWILLKDGVNQSDKVSETASNARNKKKKNKQSESSASNQKSNLRQQPYYLDDGDLVAFALVEQNGNNKITANDFMSSVDLELGKKENMTKAEVSKLKKERNNSNEGTNRKTRSMRNRPEVGITIQTDEF